MSVWIRPRRQNEVPDWAMGGHRAHGETAACRGTSIEAPRVVAGFKWSYSCQIKTCAHPCLTMHACGNTCRRHAQQPRPKAETKGVGHGAAVARIVGWIRGVVLPSGPVRSNGQVKSMRIAAIADLQKDNIGAGIQLNRDTELAGDGSLVGAVFVHSGAVDPHTAAIVGSRTTIAF